jgi:CubicO group peptidase (beta-lactamase class C family)
MPLSEKDTQSSSNTSDDKNSSPSAANDKLAKHADKINQLENALTSTLHFQGDPRTTYNLQERMQHYKVPAVSIALIDQGEIAWAKSWGVKNVDTQEPVTPNTLFQAASISKKVAALGALRMVETGQLSLDQPINNYLTRWQLPENDFTKDVPVTLTHLLSHTGGTTVHGFRGYAQTEEQPTALHVLNGDAIANSDPVVVDTLPGTNFRYSGGGSTVYQVAMEDVSQKSFTQLMDELVLTPAGMTHSTYAQPLPESYQGDVASGHLSEGDAVPGGWHNYPTQSAASLWTTPSDLAQYSLSVINAYHGTEGQGDTGTVLSKPICDQMLTEQQSAWGLGPRLFMDEGKTIGFHHGGANEGYRCNSVAFLDGRGAVVMTNSDVGDDLLIEIMAAAAEVYDWPAYKPQVIEWLPFTDNEKTDYAGEYTFVHEGETYTVTVEFYGEGFAITFPWFKTPVAFRLTDRKDDTAHCMGGVNIPIPVVFSKDEAGKSIATSGDIVFSQ